MPVAYERSAAAAPHTIRVTADVAVQPSGGYERVIRAGSTWRYSGRVPQGDVYRPVDGVFTLEGAHVHEAYLVVSERSLAGFFLPVEQAFSALPARVRLPLE